jgi:hypothetical protein
MRSHIPPITPLMEFSDAIFLLSPYIGEGVWRLSGEIAND